MCIIAFQYDENKKQITIAANRDEFYDRPAAPIHEWQIDGTTIYGGRDLKEGGTWLAVSEQGRFVAITNYRDLKLEQEKPHSRGQIATDFLTESVHAKQFAEQLQNTKDLYGPYNVLLFDGEQLIHYNNVTNVVTKIESGIHVLCNATLNTPWPKVERLRETFTDALQQPSNEELLRILQDSKKAPVHSLPNTGIGTEMELELSSIFIRLPDYGTRCSTIGQITPHTLILDELTYDRGEKGCHHSIVVERK